MISHASRLTNDALALIMEQEQQQSISFRTDLMNPKRQELEEMKKKLIEQIDEKRHNLKLLKIYIDKLSTINDWCLRGKDMLVMHPLHISNDKIVYSLTELEEFLVDLSKMNIEELQNTAAPEPLHSMITQIFNRVNDVRELCEKRCEQLRYLAKSIHRPIQNIRQLTIESNQLYNQNESLEELVFQQSSNAKIDKKQRNVITELLVTEQVYVEELHIIIESYMIKFDDPEYNRHLSSVILQNKNIIFSNLPDIYAFHATSFLRDLEQINEDSLTINAYSIGSAIAACFIKRKSNFKLYEQYVINKTHSERIWEQYCVGHVFFQKIQQSLGHRLPLDSYLLKPIQRITQYQLFLKEMIKYTRHEHERLHLQEALCVMLNILSYLNDVMHSTQIIGYPDNLSTLGKIRLRAENCLISKEKRRGSVYTRTKTSTRDMFLFERSVLLCKKKDEGNGKSVQYQYKEMIRIADVIVCSHSKIDRKKMEIILKDCSYIIAFSFNNEISEQMGLRWIDTIKSCVTQQIEHRRIVAKHRSTSLDHSLRSNRRRLLSRTNTNARSPESDDEQIHLPIASIDLNNNSYTRENRKMTIKPSISHL